MNNCKYILSIGNDILLYVNFDISLKNTLKIEILYVLYATVIP